MFAKRLLQKVNKNPSSPRNHLQHGSVTSGDMDLRVVLHYGIPSTASIFAFDPVQRLLAVGTLDGRIKVIGGENIEGLLISRNPLPYKYLEFLHNQGFLVSISNDNDIQLWDLERRCIASSLQWQSNITAFSVICGTYFMYIGDEYGLISVLKYDTEEGKLLQLPYHIHSSSIADIVGVSQVDHQSIVGILPQPCNSGNRVLIAFGSGLIILWDISEDQVVVVRGNKVLLLQETSEDSASKSDNDLLEAALVHEEEEKEISSVCWASSDGSIVAVGYVDGDIMLWDISKASVFDDQQAGMPSNGVAKIQLSSGKRRIPVIVLHWAPDNGSQANCKGQLFIYGGDEIGSDEVLTVLSLEWSSGAEILRCVGRVDLTLGGSFADMILIPKAGAIEKDSSAALFVLTNPGQLHVYSDADLSALLSAVDKGSSSPTMKFPMVVPMVNPDISITKLSMICDENSSKALSEIASITKIGATPTTTAASKWPLTGGIPYQLSSTEDRRIEKIYIAGYQDGSLRIWDATYPALSPILALDGKVEEITVAGASAPLTALDFCSPTTCLAVGNQCGLVFIYKSGNSKDSNFHYVTETKHEVHAMQQEKGLQLFAIFSALNSPVQTLQYENFGAKISVGYECGRVAMLDICSASVLFITDCISSSSSPIVSISVKACPGIINLINSPKLSSTENLKAPESLMFILTRDSHIVVVDSITGNMVAPRPMHPKGESTAISMYVIEQNISISEVSNGKSTELSKDSCAHGETLEVDTDSGVKLPNLEIHTSSETVDSGERISDSFVLLCSTNALRLYPLKSVIKGNKKSIRKVKLVNPCCWTALFKMEEDNLCGLILLYQTGILEIRSLPDMEVVLESSLSSILRWSYKANMNKTMSSNNSQITLANGCELAFISVLACENDSRIQESLPCLHDKVVAAAVNAAISFSSNQKKKQASAPGILSGIVKGLKGKKVESATSPREHQTISDFNQHLESIFSREPVSVSSADIVVDDEEVVELSIDDIEIDEPVRVVPVSSDKGKLDTTDKKTEREKLFDGANADMKPRVRTREEIIAKYRKTGDASSAASQAKDKLVERQEKLERISRRTAEMQNNAESFADMANELVKVMESRKKWWQI